MSAADEPNEKHDSYAIVGLLHEYDSLRSEILRAQEQRIQIISLTVGAVAAIITLGGNVVFGTAAITPGRQLLAAIGAGIGVYIILIPSLIMMIATQQSVRRIGGYIAKYIEPEVPGLHWERRWSEIRTTHKFRGLSAQGTIYIFLAFLAWLLPAYGLTQFPEGGLLLIFLVPFLLWALYLSLDLRFALSKSWTYTEWPDDKPANSTPTTPAPPSSKSRT